MTHQRITLRNISIDSQKLRLNHNPKGISHEKAIFNFISVATYPRIW